MPDPQVKVGDLSPEGHYRWNGSEWQLVGHESSPPSSDASAPARGQLSEDGYYRWNGSEWQLVADALVHALGEQGITVDAAVVGDTKMVQRVITHLDKWYGGLDAESRTIVDSLCSRGLTHLLADPEVAVVSEGAELLYALAGAGHTLGESLQAATHAIRQSGASA